MEINNTGSKFEGVCNWSGKRVKGYMVPYEEYLKSDLNRSDIVGYICPSCSVVSDSHSDESGITFNRLSGFEKSRCKKCSKKIPKPTFVISEASLSEAANKLIQQRSKGESINEAEETKQNSGTEESTEQKPSSLGKAAEAGAVGGVIAGLVSHYLAGGKMTVLIFIIAYILILSRLKGWGKLVALIVFTAVASLVVVVFQHR